GGQEVVALGEGRSRIGQGRRHVGPDAAAPHAERVATRAGEVMERLTAHD
ncbi:MAG: hypothetical protein JWM72_1107, partial [Actinomycetia bacterium]|nr:hypothetical protein [Actinomycetes bacterium]